MERDCDGECKCRDLAEWPVKIGEVRRTESIGPKFPTDQGMVTDKGIADCVELRGLQCNVPSQELKAIEISGKQAVCYHRKCDVI